MSIELPQTIEFINGPLDGHVEILSIGAERMPESLACYISKNVFRLLDGRNYQHHFRITSVAIYKRERRMNSWNYTFTAVVAPGEVTLEPIAKPSSSDDG